ncbi:hypothetical protein [Bradyrhizobium sp. S69]|uniref:hypothetical protein n=1 Tax=Bradyrhizobium sp. S69 TaxID=1641856 RepID=UPI001AEE36B4|nr:hypothetical protein [Bradyrhizobium sp. S69]
MAIQIPRALLFYGHIIRASATYRSPGTDIPMNDRFAPTAAVADEQSNLKAVYFVTATGRRIRDPST